MSGSNGSKNNNNGRDIWNWPNTWNGWWGSNNNSGNNSYGGSILPVEPGQNDQDSDDEIQQKLDSERIGGMIEDIFEGEGGEDEPGIDMIDVNDQEPTRARLAANLGEPNAPLLLDAAINLPANVDMQSGGRELADLVVNTIREGLADAIENDFDEFVYIPLSVYTQKNKKRKGQAKPNMPLYGTGLLVQNMRPGGWLTGFTWEKNKLKVRWGPKEIDDLHPSMKYRDMFFGNPGTGKGHRVKVPRRFPNVSDQLKQQVVEVILDWLRMHQDQSASTNPQDGQPMFDPNTN